MGGYQSDSNNAGGLSPDYWKTKGVISLESNTPFPPGVRNDAWIIDGSGTIGGMFYADEGDILFCIDNNSGGDFIDGWIVIPHKSPQP